MKEYLQADAGWQIILFILFSLASWIYQMWKKNFSESAKNKPQQRTFTAEDEEEFPWLKELKKEFKSEFPDEEYEAAKLEVEQEKKEYEEYKYYDSSAKTEEVDQMITRAEEAEKEMDKTLSVAGIDKPKRKKHPVRKLPLLHSKSGIKQAVIYGEIFNRKY